MSRPTATVLLGRALFGDHPDSLLEEAPAEIRQSYYREARRILYGWKLLGFTVVAKPAAKGRRKGKR